MGIPIALQMRGVQAEAAKDFGGVLDRIAAMGYRGVEFSGFGGQSAGALTGRLEGLGIFPVAAHVPLEDLEKDLDGTAAFASELGVPFIVCAQAPAVEAASVKKQAALFNSLGERIQSAGIGFCVSTRGLGAGALDLLFKETDPALVEIELDIRGALAAGADPGRYLAAYAGRCPLVILGDMKPGGGSVGIGEGTADIPAVAKAAEAGGVEWLIVDREPGGGSGLEGAQADIGALKRMGIA